MALDIALVRCHISSKLEEKEPFVPGPLIFTKEELASVSAIYQRLHTDLHAKGINCEDQMVQGKSNWLFSGAKLIL